MSHNSLSFSTAELSPGLLNFSQRPNLFWVNLSFNEVYEINSDEIKLPVVVTHPIPDNY
jgi:hypothetical protein